MNGFEKLSLIIPGQTRSLGLGLFSRAPGCTNSGRSQADVGRREVVNRGYGRGIKFKWLIRVVC